MQNTAITTQTATATGSGFDVDAAVRATLPLVGHIVRETLLRVPGHVNRDDLTSAGMAALAAAATGYDPARGVPFARYAAQRIRGAVIDELRGQDWASRSVRTRSRHIDTLRHQLTADLGRTPTTTEIATAAGITETQVTAIDDDVQRAVVLSLQGFAPGTADDMITDTTAGPEDLLLHRERIGFLHQAVEALPAKLRTVITGYYLHGRPMADIAADLGVTESRVSQLRAEALTLLRDGINTQLAPEQVTTPARPEGVVARRRQTYYTAIAATGTLHTRLAHTDIHGLTLAA